jgi:hypothetical protein
MATSVRALQPDLVSNLIAQYGCGSRRGPLRSEATMMTTEFGLPADTEHFPDDVERQHREDLDVNEYPNEYPSEVITTHAARQVWEYLYQKPWPKLDGALWDPSPN